MPRNRLKGRGHWLIAAVLVGATLAGCNQDQAGPTSPSPSASASASPSPSNTPAPSSSPSLDAGDRAAADAATAFMQMKERIRSNPSEKVELIYTVARGATAEKWSATLFDDRVAGRRQTGEFVLTLQHVEPGTSARQRLVSMCVDSTDVNLLDKDGKSLSNKDNPQKVVTVFTVDQDAKTFKWYVTKDEVTETC